MSTPIATHREPLLTPADLSAELGIPETTLSNWRYQGQGPAYLRVGKHARYRRADVDRWLDQRARDTSVA